MLPLIFIVGAKCAFDFRRIGNDIGSVAGPKFPHRQYAGFFGVGLTGDESFQRRVNLYRRVDRVNGAVGICSVAALTSDGNTKTVDGVHHDAAAVVHKQPDGHGSRRHMAGHGRVHRRIFEDAVGDHVVTALKGFLGGLKHQFDLSFEMRFVFFQHFCCRQEHGGVEIVAAGVSMLLGGAGEGFAAFLGHG